MCCLLTEFQMHPSVVWQRLHFSISALPQVRHRLQADLLDERAIKDLSLYGSLDQPIEWGNLEPTCK